MVKLLYKLKKNYTLILLSNTDEIHFAYCTKNYKVLGIFDDFILSYKIGCKKPNPFIYLCALRKAKALPSKVLYIDDIASYVTAARLFGIRAIQYKNFEKLKNGLKKINIKI